MSIGGWIIMILSLSAVSGLAAFCYYRALTTPGSSKHMHAPLELEGSQALTEDSEQT